MKIIRHFFCEIKRNREPAPQLCAVCPRIIKCKSFRSCNKLYHQEYLNFVVDITKKFPDKYAMEVYFMAEKQTFVQIVDIATGKIEKVVSLTEIESLSAEDKLTLSRNKTLFIVTHRIEPIVKIELKKSVINAPIQFMDNIPKEEEPIEEVTPLPIKPDKPKAKRPTKS